MMLLNAKLVVLVVVHFLNPLVKEIVNESMVQILLVNAVVFSGLLVHV
jgi:hypothetical protein